MKEPIYIVIPVHNRRETTLACLDHLQACGDLQRYHTVVVDDGSTDGTASAIEKLYPGVEIVGGDGNLWWTGAIARGMEYAAGQGAEYFVWLNDDCLPTPGALEQLVAFMASHPDTIAAPACATLLEGRLVIKNNGLQGRSSVAPDPEKVVWVDALLGWCVGIPAGVFRKLGPPNAKRFPHYSGDDTYILKATRSGFKACLVGRIEVLLVEPTREASIRNYFRQGRGPLETFQAAFVSKKSEYRLCTRFFYLLERYGPLLGVPLFVFRTVQLLAWWVQLQSEHWLSNQQKAG